MINNITDHIPLETISWEIISTAPHHNPLFHFLPPHIHLSTSPIGHHKSGTNVKFLNHHHMFVKLKNISSGRIIEHQEAAKQPNQSSRQTSHLAAIGSLHANQSSSVLANSKKVPIFTISQSTNCGNLSQWLHLQVHQDLDSYKMSNCRLVQPPTIKPKIGICLCRSLKNW